MTIANRTEIEDEVFNAYKELKKQMTELLFNFTSKYYVQGSKTYPYSAYVMLDVLVESLGEVEYQIKGCPPFTAKQKDHICYQVGEWYIAMKPLLEEQHNLGFMKEKLKKMICGDE